MAIIDQLITDNLDIWSSAIKAKKAAGRGTSKKIELYGIKKLRKLILELAVRGLLVPQAPNDEPASELLNKITIEKTKLIKDGKIKKQKTTSLFSEEEELFKVPENWSWQRLGEIGEIFNGNSINASVKERKYTNISGIPFIATKDVGYGFEELDYKNGVSIPAEEDKFKIAKKGSVLICAEGGSAGKKCGIAMKDIYFGNKLFANVLYGSIEPKYILSLFLSPSFFKRLSESMTGIIGGISRAKFMMLPVPIPPLKEQRRIVAKIDELMALCDQLEQQTETSISAHQTLVQSLLEALTNTSEHEGFNQAWAIIAEHYDTLFTTEWSIDQFKQTILQLAVMGKLVPQNSSNEPASVLFKNLSIERDRWIKENLNSNSECKTMARKLEKLTEPAVPFPLPESWCCVHLIQLSQLLVDCHNKTAPYVNSGIPIIRTTNIRDREFRYEGMKYVNEETYEYWSRRCPPKSGDIMFTREAPMGEAAIIPEGVKWCLGQRTMLIRPMQGYVSEKYLLLALTEPHLLERASEHAIGSTVKHLRVGDVENLNIPLPPFEEQQRITAKVDELMVLCDTLKTSINIAQITQLHLADAMADQALN